MDGPETQEKEKCGRPGEKRREAEGKNPVPSPETGKGKVCAWFLIRVTARCHIQPQHKENWQRKGESIKFGASWA